jgi:RPA family protein
MAKYKSVVIPHNLPHISPRILGKKLRELIETEFYKKVDLEKLIALTSKAKTYKNTLKPKLEPELYEKIVQWKESIDDLKPIPIKYTLSALLELYVSPQTQVEKNIQTEPEVQQEIQQEDEWVVDDEEQTETRVERGPTESELAKIDKQHRLKVNQYIENRLNSINAQLEELIHKYNTIVTELQDVKRQISNLKSDYELFKDNVQRILLCIEDIENNE